MYNISFKAYDNKKLKHIHRSINTSAWIWNHCIALQKRYYSLYKKYINVNKLQKHISKLRNKNKIWKDLNSQTVQEICQRVDSAYNRFFKKLSKRPPKFKKTISFNSFVLKQSGWEIQDNVLTINKIEYKFSKSRDYENIKRITVKRNKLGEIFFILCCDIKPKNFERVGNSTIGIDFGLKTYLTISNGKEIISPEFFKKHLKLIKSLNKKFSKKKKGSNNYKKSLKNLQRAYIKISNRRSDFEWKLVHNLCKNNSFIAIEDLDIESMKKKFGRKISDLSFSSFVNKLEQIALKYDVIIQKIDRYYPSTKLCNSCGHKQDLSLSDREYVCTQCGMIDNRDLNAAKNILTEGIRLYSTKHKTVICSSLGLKVESHRL